VIPPPRPSDNPDDVAAFVLYGAGRTACVLHEDGPEHPNFRATVERLESRGYTVVPPPADVAPLLASAPREARHRARELLRAALAAA